MMTFAGGCPYGDVRVRASGESWRVGICHWLDGRKRRGALFFAAAVFQERNFTSNCRFDSGSLRNASSRWPSLSFRRR